MKTLVYHIALVSLVGLFSVHDLLQKRVQGGGDTLQVVPDTVRIDSAAANQTEADSLIDERGKPALPVFRQLENHAFTVGERLVFDVGYGFVTAGEAYMEVSGYDFHNSRKCYRIQFEVRSLPFFSVFYKVEDHYLTVMDVEGLFPWRFEQRIREGTYRRDFSAEFDHLNEVAVTTEGTFPIPRYVHDIVSAFYFTRTLDFSGFEPGQSILLHNFYKDTTYDLPVRFRGKQIVDVPAGRFSCIVIEPLVREGGLFKSDGRIIMWLTDDEKKIPVKVSSRIIIGSISAELREYFGISGRIPAMIKKRH